MPENTRCARESTHPFLARAFTLWKRVLDRSYESICTTTSVHLCLLIILAGGISRSFFIPIIINFPPVSGWLLFYNFLFIPPCGTKIPIMQHEEC